MSKRVAIIGAGPAGLTAAYLLAKGNQEVVVFEKDPQYVGGISRTESYNGYHFDIGGHRFFSKSKEVEDFWTEILGDEMLERPRSSRIYYNNHFFSYPLVAFEALRKLGIFESALCVLSYLKAKAFPVKNPTNFEEWVTNQFGKRLFNIFFKTYTEKVWGIPCNEISADWAAQRIKGLSLSSAIFNALFKPNKKATDKDKVIKTLIDSFRYPKQGPGMMWEACAEKSKAMGVTLHMNCGVQKIEYTGSNWTVQTTSQGSVTGFDYVLSTAPMRELVANVLPAFPATVAANAAALGYRDFLTVVLICKDEDAFSDNWIYIHDPSVHVCRIQNFKSWSPFMVKDGYTCLGLEYFVNVGDHLWEMDNDLLVALGKNELASLNIVNVETITEGYVFRMPKAYPMYNSDYQTNVSTIREWLNENLTNVYPVGRNGMHRYNNQDHSMYTAMLAVENIFGAKNDIWSVNIDDDYHEEVKD